MAPIHASPMVTMGGDKKRLPPLLARRVDGANSQFQSQLETPWGALPARKSLDPSPAGSSDVGKGRERMSIEALAGASCRSREG